MLMFISFPAIAHEWKDVLDGTFVHFFSASSDISSNASRTFAELTPKNFWIVATDLCPIIETYHP